MSVVFQDKNCQNVLTGFFVYPRVLKSSVKLTHLCVTVRQHPGFMGMMPSGLVDHQSC